MQTRGLLLYSFLNYMLILYHIMLISSNPMWEILFVCIHFRTNSCQTFRVCLILNFILLVNFLIIYLNIKKQKRDNFSRFCWNFFIKSFTFSFLVSKLYTTFIIKMSIIFFFPSSVFTIMVKPSIASTINLLP